LFHSELARVAYLLLAQDFLLEADAAPSPDRRQGHREAALHGLVKSMLRWSLTHFCSIPSLLLATRA